MLNIEIYIDTCEDQAVSTPKKGGEERPQETLADGSGNHLSKKFTAWFFSTDEKNLPKVEMKNER